MRYLDAPIHATGRIRTIAWGSHIAALVGIAWTLDRINRAIVEAMNGDVQADLGEDEA